MASLYQPIPPIAASADPRNHALLREAKAKCARLGYSLNVLSDQKINLAELDAAFRGKDLQSRMECKSALALLHLI